MCDSNTCSLTIRPYKRLREKGLICPPAKRPKGSESPKKGTRLALPGSLPPAPPLTTSALSGSLPPAPLLTTSALPGSALLSPTIDKAPNCRTRSQIALPEPVEICLGSLEYYASPPDLSTIKARKNVDKIKLFFQGLPTSFKYAFASHIRDMENGKSIKLSHDDAKKVLDDLCSDESQNYLYHLSQYAQISCQYLSDQSQINITTDHARQPFHTKSLNKVAQECWDNSWNGFNQTLGSLESELLFILPHTRFNPDYPSNVSIEFKPTDRHHVRYLYFSFTREPINPSTMALSEATMGTLGMKKITPLSTFRLMDNSGASLMSGQLTPTGVFLLHTIDTKDTSFSSGEVIDLTLSITRVLKAKSIILYDAAKIYYPGKDRYYLYSKAMAPQILAGTKQAFYEAPDRGGFTYFEDNTAVLDEGTVLTFEGMKATDKKATLDQAFGETTMGKFKGLINKAKPYKDIPDGTPLLTHWTTLLSNYISEGRTWRNFSKLVTFLDDLTSIKDIPEAHPLFDEALQNAITLWARPEFYYLKL